ncbi:hypothetical protein IAR55_002695 [Kwoniella newhampshirensis]|uniref:Uncharacterized protein n=1 Tax=Kwoniella newhampshirensis TaxID=1651941 RepID=A0AAW0YRP0_9TREE
MRISRSATKLALAGPKATNSLAPTIRPCAQSSRQAHSTAITGTESFGSPTFSPGLVLNTVPPPQTTSKLDPTGDFFRSSQPFPKSQSTLSTTPENHDETDLLRQLRDLLALPASSRNQWRSTQIWRLYRILSPAFRRSLDIATMQNVFQSVLPNTFFVQKITGPIEASTAENLKLRLHKYRNLGEKWERRLRTVAADMMAAHPDKVDPRVFVKPLRKLAMLGEKTGCEEIIREVRYRYDGNGKVQVSPKLLRQMYNSGLQSVARWLGANAHRWRSAQRDIAEAIEVTRRLVTAMQEANIPPSPRTADSLLNTARFVSSASTDQTTRKAFDRLTEMILTEGYGLNLNEAKAPGLHSEAKLRNAARMAVIDMLGRKGDVFGMIAAADHIFTEAEERMQRLSSISEKDSNVEVEEDIPTLSSMLAAEQAARAERGWFGRKTSKVEEQSTSAVGEFAEQSTFNKRRRFADFLSPIPTPDEVMLTQSSDAGEISTRLRASLQSLRNPAHWSALTSSENATVHSMLSRAWLSKDKAGPSDTSYKYVSLHILRVALRAAHAEQSRWIGQLLSGVHAPKTLELPILCVDPNWFRTVWRTVRHTRSGSSRGVGCSSVILEELDEAVNRIEQEQNAIAQALAKLEVESDAEVNRSGPAATATEAFDVTGHLERLVQTKESLLEVREMIGQQVEITMARTTKARQAEKAKRAEREAQTSSQRGSKLAGKLLKMRKSDSGDALGALRWEGTQPALA